MNSQYPMLTAFVIACNIALDAFTFKLSPFKNRFPFIFVFLPKVSVSCDLGSCYRMQYRPGRLHLHSLRIQPSFSGYSRRPTLSFRMQCSLLYLPTRSRCLCLFLGPLILPLSFSYNPRLPALSFHILWSFN